MTSMAGGAHPTKYEYVLFYCFLKSRVNLLKESAYNRELFKLSQGIFMWKFSFQTISISMPYLCGIKVLKQLCVRRITFLASRLQRTLKKR
jgi:hypothetical protein